MKACIECGERKPLDQFHKDSSRSDGRCIACKECRRARERARYVKRPRPVLSIDERKTLKREALEVWRDANRDKTRAISMRWNAKNKDKLNAAQKKYQAANVAKISEKQREKRRANPHIPRAQSAGREAAKLRAVPSWAHRAAIAERYALARDLTKTTGFQWHVDHIVPLRSSIVCGLHCEANLQVIPASLNCSKNNRHWPDMPSTTKEIL